MEIIKKGLIQMFALVALMGSMPVAHAQMDSVGSAGVETRACQSRWTRYDPLKESSSIVRSNNYNHVTHTQSIDGQKGIFVHTFVVKDVSGMEKAFTTYFNAMDSTAYDVDVTDMRLFVDTCYFCGTLTHSYADYTGNLVTHGIVGRFVVPHVLAGTGSLQFYEVEKTAGLRRLAISQASGADVLISAIGDVASSRTSCIVEMKPWSGSQWVYWLDTLETPTRTFFTDIMTMRDSLRLLLQYRCNNDFPYGHGSYDNRHQLFMLDRFGLKGCKDSYSTAGVYYMAHYDMIADGDCFFHRKEAPMRLSHLNDLDKQFAVAFGVRETDGNHGGLRLFTFQHEWKYDSCIYYRMGRYVDIKEVGNLYKTATMILLSADNTHANGIVTMPELGTATHVVTQLVAPGYAMNSFTQKFVGNHIDISGHGSSSELHLLDQDVTLLSLPTCFSKSTREYTLFKGQQAARLVAEWKFGDVTEFSWVNLNDVTKPELVKPTVCEKC